MPISREELEEGRIDLSIPIVGILTCRPDLGFSAHEIQQLLLETDGRNAPIAEVERALEILVQRDRVRMGAIEDQRWYTISATKIRISNGTIGMPISKRQLELGIDSEAEEWMRQAYHLLAENRDLAYSTWELQEAVLGTAPFPEAKSQKFAGVLDILAETGAADKGVVDEIGYYIFRHTIDTNTWERDLSKV